MRLHIPPNGWIKNPPSKIIIAFNTLWKWRLTIFLGSVKKEQKTSILYVMFNDDTTRKRGFNRGYLAEVNITLEIDLINGGFL